MKNFFAEIAVQLIAVLITTGVIVSLLALTGNL